MKKKRTAIVAFVLVAILCLGIGFAALSDDLHIDGKLNFKVEEANKVFDTEVYFSAATVETTPSHCKEGVSITATVGADDNGDANDKVTITVPAGVFTYVGDTAVIKASIKNDSPVAVNVAVTSDASVTDTDGVFTVDCAVDAENAKIEKESVGENIVTITIKLNKSIDVTDATFSFTLTATTVED